MLLPIIVLFLATSLTNGSELKFALADLRQTLKHVPEKPALIRSLLETLTGSMALPQLQCEEDGDCTTVLSDAHLFTTQLQQAYGAKMPDATTTNVTDAIEAMSWKDDEPLADPSVQQALVLVRMQAKRTDIQQYDSRRRLALPLMMTMNFIMTGVGLFFTALANILTGGKIMKSMERSVDRVVRHFRRRKRRRQAPHIDH